MSSRLLTPHAVLGMTARSQLASSTLVKTVEQALTASDVTSGARLVLGCSGGPDSTALMLALWLLRERYHWQVQIVCINHGLRQAATNEAQLVSGVAQKLGLLARVITVEVAKQSSLQAAARTARYQALTEAAREFDSPHLLLGHTLDDQAETVLQRLLGGAGPRGLAGMPHRRMLPHQAQKQPPERPVELLRPLLSIERRLVLELLRSAPELVEPLPLTDPSNHDLRFSRSVIRHVLLPQLRSMQPSVVPHLGKLAEQLREDADYLDELAMEKLPNVIDQSAPCLPGQLVALSVSRFRTLPRPLSTRLLLRLGTTPLSSVHLSALHSLCAHSRGTQSLDLPGGITAERCYDTLYLRHEVTRPAQKQPEQVLLPDYGDYVHGPYRIRLRRLSPSEPLTENPSSVVLSLPSPGFPLWLRSPRPGDRLRLPGGHRKVSDLLIDAKLPRSERSAMLILGHQQEPLWLVGLRAAIRSPLTPNLCYVRIAVELLESISDSPSLRSLP